MDRKTREKITNFWKYFFDFFLLGRLPDLANSGGSLHCSCEQWSLLVWQSRRRRRRSKRGGGGERLTCGAAGGGGEEERCGGQGIPYGGSFFFLFVFSVFLLPPAFVSLLLCFFFCFYWCGCCLWWLKAVLGAAPRNVGGGAPLFSCKIPLLPLKSSLYFFVLFSFVLSGFLSLFP